MEITFPAAAAATATAFTTALPTAIMSRVGFSSCSLSHVTHWQLSELTSALCKCVERLNLFKALSANVLHYVLIQKSKLALDGFRSVHAKPFRRHNSKRPPRRRRHPRHCRHRRHRRRLRQKSRFNECWLSF